MPRLGDRRALLLDWLDEPGLRHPHGDGREIALVVQHAELALDLLDVELHLLELILHADAVADRGGLRHEPEEHVLLRPPVPQPGLEVDELGGHVLAGHPLLPDRAQPLDVAERALEPVGRHPKHQRPGVVLPRGGFGGGHVASVPPGHQRGVLEPLLERAVPDPKRDAGGLHDPRPDRGQVGGRHAVRLGALAGRPRGGPGRTGHALDRAGRRRGAWSGRLSAARRPGQGGHRQESRNAQRHSLAHRDLLAQVYASTARRGLGVPGWRKPYRPVRARRTSRRSRSGPTRVAPRSFIRPKISARWISGVIATTSPGRARSIIHSTA